MSNVTGEDSSEFLDMLARHKARVAEIEAELKDINARAVVLGPETIARLDAFVAQAAPGTNRDNTVEFLVAIFLNWHEGNTSAPTDQLNH